MREFVRRSRRERGNNHRNRMRVLASSTALVAVSTLALFAPALPAQAQTSWTGTTSTNWFTISNWTAGVPTGGGDTAIIDTVTPRPTVISGVPAAFATVLLIGRNNTGQLTIQGGGTLFTSIGVIGEQSGSHGTVTVTGSSSHWFTNVLVVGGRGSGTLTLENGGRVDSTTSIVGSISGSQGTVTVTGLGSIWTAGDLTVAREGTGALTVSNGGVVASTGGVIGAMSGSQGTVTVTGAGSLWSNSGNLLVGVGGTGSTGSLTIADGGAVGNVVGGVGIGSGSQGTVTVTGAGSTWTNSSFLIVGDIAGTGTLTIANGGAVSSAGGSVGVGASHGTVTVTGAGSTWTNSSALVVGDTGGTGTLTIADGGTVSASAVTLAGGVGSIGTLNIGAAPGSAPVAPGTLITPTVAFGDGTGTLNFNHTATGYVFAPTISGAGSVNVLSGTTILTAVSTYTGPTTVDGGALIVNGSIASSPVTVNPGALLGGVGTVGPTTINGGTLSPGNSIGTITVNGNLAFSTAASYLVEISPSAADRTNVSGTATLAGTVRLVAAPGNYGPTTYTILSAGAVSGSFAGLTVSGGLPLLLIPTLSYDPNNVFLTLTPAFASVAQTPNQTATAGAVQALGSGNKLFDAVLGLGTAAEVRQAFDLLSGEIHASAAGVMLDESRYVRDAVLGRARQSYGGVGGPLAALGPNTQAIAYVGEPGQALAYRGEKQPVYKAGPPAPTPSEPVFAAWTQAIGAWGRTEGNSNAATLDRTVGGFIGGLDATIAQHWRLGLAGGYTRSSIDLDARASSASIDNVHLALYGGGQFGPLGVRGGAAYTWHNIDTRRTIAFPGFFDATRADYDAHTAQAFGEIGYAVLWGRAAIEPFAAVAHVNLDTDPFRETGGGGVADRRRPDVGHDLHHARPARRHGGGVRQRHGGDGARHGRLAPRLRRCRAHDGARLRKQWRAVHHRRRATGQRQRGRGSRSRFRCHRRRPARHRLFRPARRSRPGPRGQGEFPLEVLSSALRNPMDFHAPRASAISRSIDGCCSRCATMSLISLTARAVNAAEAHWVNLCAI